MRMRKQKLPFAMEKILLFEIEKKIAISKWKEICHFKFFSQFESNPFRGFYFCRF